MQFLTRFKNFVLDILFPIPALPANLRLYDTLFCAVCRARFAENKKTCHQSSQFMLGAAARYDNEIKNCVWQLKYRNRRVLSEPLSKILISYIENVKLNIEKYVIVPMPLSRERLRTRGYNQSELIASRIAERFGLAMETGALVRQKHTAPQAEVRGWDERRKNIAGCFGVLHPELVEGRNIILVDDVFTSGATMSEAAHQLKDFGAKKILGLVIAKAG